MNLFIFMINLTNMMK